MYDEMKLQENILFNVFSNRMVGFSKNFIRKKKTIKNMLDKDELELFCEPAKYVNRWCYRSTNGCAFNSEFWFNVGSLVGETLMEQFNQVVIHCGTIVFYFHYII